MIGIVASALVSVLATLSTAVAPPDPDPDPDPEPEQDTSFERQLAELSFAIFLAVELGVDAGDFSCTEPETLDAAEALTCFTLIEGQRVIVATTAVSGASGVYDFEVVSDSALSLAEAIPTTTTPTPSTASLAAGQANAAIMLYGDSINQIAQNEIIAMINNSQGVVASVTTWAWDPATVTLTLDFTLNPTANLNPDTSAWIAVQSQAAHWKLEQPFRESEATLRPRLVVVVDGVRYVSEYDLVVRVADQQIALSEWVAAARQY